MRILFIRPAPDSDTIGLKHVMIVEPLELEILATLVEKHNDVLIIDLILEKQPSSYFIETYKPDVICITGYITHIYQMLEVCREAKRIDERIVTVVGGVYIEKVPESIDDPDVDYRVVRNAVRAFPMLISFLQNKADFPPGVLRKSEVSDENKLPEYNFDVPIPNRQLTRKYRSKYFYVFHNKVALLKTSFGCPYPCIFCFCRKITGDNYHERHLDEVIEELKTIDEKEVYIVDDNFLVSETRIRQFIDLLRDNNIKKRYLVYGRADFISENPEIMRDFKKEGLRTIIVGFESFNDNELDALNKHTFSRTNEDAMHVLNRNGIDCYASVIAMPSWDKSDFDSATRKLIELKVRFLNIQPLTPLEKTDMAYDEDRLIVKRDEYPKWDLAHVVIKPEKLSVREYYSEILRMYQRVLFQTSNMINHFKYPLHMQVKLFWGVNKVQKHYKEKIIQS